MTFFAVTEIAGEEGRRTGENRKECYDCGVVERDQRYSMFGKETTTFLPSAVPYVLNTTFVKV